MVQLIPRLLLLIAVTGMGFSALAFVLSVVSPPASARITQFAEKLAIPVHVLLVTAILAELTKPGFLYRLGAMVDSFSFCWLVG